MAKDGVVVASRSCERYATVLAIAVLAQISLDYLLTEDGKRLVFSGFEADQPVPDHGNRRTIWEATSL